MPRLLGVFAALLALACIPTQAAPPTSVRIALLSDTHTTSDTKEDQPLYRGRFERVLASVNAAKIDLVLIAGDLTQNGRPDELVDFKEQTAGFAAPVCVVPGNHDVGNKSNPRKGTAGPMLARLATYEKHLGPSFYARDVAGIRVIGINTQLFGAALPQAEQQWALLERELAAPVSRPTVVLMHMPPFLTAADEPGDDYWNIEPAPRQRLLDLLDRAQAPTVLTGHLHLQASIRHHGTLFFTTMPVSFGLPRGEAPQGWTLVTIPLQDGRQTAEAQVTPQPVAD